MNRILYIAGYGRSGSTMLDSILSTHPDVFGAGEIELLLGDIAAGGSCTCGEPYIDCNVWGKVLGDVFDEDIEADAARLAAELRGFESPRGASRSESGDTAAAYAAFWKAAFASIFEHGHASVIVDSTKTARGNERRIAELARCTGADVRVVHLVRDPRAVLYSCLIRGNNVSLEGHRESRPSTFGLLRPYAGWLAANLAVTTARRRVPGLQVLTVRYEDLVTDAERTLASIGAFAEIDMATVADLVSHGGLIEPGHGVLGNRMRRGGPIRLRLDSEWISESPRRARAVGSLFAPFARLYGYSTWRWPKQNDAIDGLNGIELAGGPAR